MLEELATLDRRAAREPHGMFGETAAHLADDLELAAEAFTDFTTDDRYSQSNESVVFGGQPDFEQVFRTAIPTRLQSMIDFCRRYRRFHDAPYDRSAQAYVYAPEAP